MIDGREFELALALLGASGFLRVAVLWRSDVEVNVLSFSISHVDFVLKLSSSVRFILFMVVQFLPLESIHGTL